MDTLFRPYVDLANIPFIRLRINSEKGRCPGTMYRVSRQWAQTHHELPCDGFTCFSYDLVIVDLAEGAMAADLEGRRLSDSHFKFKIKNLR